jgi:hypothetical protein
MSADQAIKRARSPAAIAYRWLHHLSICALLLMHPDDSLCANEESRLPLVTDDRVVVRSEGGYRPKTISCVIEDIAGQRIVVRRSGSTVNVIRLQDVVSVQFRKSEEFNEGLKKAVHVVSGIQAAQMRFPSGLSFAELVDQEVTKHEILSGGNHASDGES